MPVILWLMRALVLLLVLVFEVLGTVISVVWLAMLGEWTAIGYWFAAAVGAHILVHFAMIPALLIVLPGRYFEKRNISIGVHVADFLSKVYLIGLIAIWCSVVFVLFSMKVGALPAIPVLALSFGVATGPWALTVVKAGSEGGDAVYEAAVPVFFAQVGYLILLAMVLFLGKTQAEALFTFGIIMLVSLLFQVVAARYIRQLAHRSTISTS